MAKSQKISGCRSCLSESLTDVVSLGNQSLTGIFPQNATDLVPLGELALVWCSSCSLVQLAHTFSSQDMYGDNYGYRSGLNPTMVSHLKRKAEWLERNFLPQSGDLLLDIGSNDGTLLNHYQKEGNRRVGFDPVASKYLQHYDEGIQVVDDFFDSTTFVREGFGKAKIITSIAMFYDLENPKQFVQQVSQALDDDGVWHFEQSYLPSMLSTNSYDTICHEHYEYYSLGVVQDILSSEGMKILDVGMNSVNGGSFAVTATHEKSALPTNSPIVNWVLDQEKKMGLDTIEPYHTFASNVVEHQTVLSSLIQDIVASGRTIAAYGASTKGNVLLQYCGLGPREILGVAEVNEDKFGKFTPGTSIPILPESEVRAMRPDYMLVLPWHFRDFVVEKESEYLNNGGRLIFPLPEIQIVS